MTYRLDFASEMFIQFADTLECVKQLRVNPWIKKKIIIYNFTIYNF